jgi:hypothetical protein
MLPGFTERTAGMLRSNWMWVCAVTRIRSLTSAMSSCIRAVEVAGVINSSSLRGDP